MAEGNQKQKRLFGIWSIPGWVFFLIAILHFAEDIEWIADKFPLLIRFVNYVVPEGVDYAVLTLSILWIVALLVGGPLLARKIGPGKAILAILIPLFVAAFVVGLVRGNQEINRENQLYKARQHPAGNR